MYGIGFAVGDGLGFNYLHPLFAVVYFALPIWPVVFFFAFRLAAGQRGLRWFLFFPFVALASSVVGSLLAGLVLWLPALGVFSLLPTNCQRYEDFSYFVLGGAIAVSFARWHVTKMHNWLNNDAAPSV